LKRTFVTNIAAVVMVVVMVVVVVVVMVVFPQPDIVSSVMYDVLSVSHQNSANHPTTSDCVCCVRVEPSLFSG
jgi:hypothetical protein